MRITSEKIILETGEVDGIPLLTLAREGLTNAPLVFYVHGFGGDKSNGLDLGYRLARQGCFFVCLDAFMHGDRIQEPMRHLGDPQGKLYPLECGLDVFFMMFQIIARTAEDIAALIAHFWQDPRANARLTGISGVSMGGMVSFLAAALNPQIVAAAPMLAYPAFAQRWQDVVTEASSYPQWSVRMAELVDESRRRLERMRAIDPLPRLAGYFPRALMMVSGERDVDAPKAYNVSLFRDLQPVYVSQPDRLRLRIYDGIDHRVTEEMNNDVCNFFVKYLIDQPAL